jgi:phosphoribosylglycinamide formyltransferase 2
MTKAALEKSKEIAEKITGELGGYGIFGVELFIKGNTVYFSEVSPRPHDTGLVTLISQDFSEFALHARAILGYPVPSVRNLGPAASVAFLAEGDSRSPVYTGITETLSYPGVSLRLFGKPSVEGKRRMGVILAADETTDAAREKAKKASGHLKVIL